MERSVSHPGGQPFARLPGATGGTPIGCSNAINYERLFDDEL